MFTLACPPPAHTVPALVAGYLVMIDYAADWDGMLARTRRLDCAFWAHDFDTNDTFKLLVQPKDGSHPEYRSRPR